MASLGDALVNKILGHSAAEKAFRPWWDNLEDYLTYGLVLLGLIVAPTAIINSTPLDCTPCQDDKRCPSDKFVLYDPVEDEIDATQVEQKLINAWWVKKFCTMTAVDGFMMYFPYILLIMALVIVLIEKLFVRIFKAGLKLDMFYNLLVKEALEDQLSTAAATGGDSVDAVDSGGGALAAVAATDLENSKQAIEVSQTFSQSSNYYYSYLGRTVLESLLGAVLFTWLLLLGLPSIQKDKFIYCKVYGYKYECAGHPQQFYMYVLFITLALIGMYLCCCFYNLLWLLIPTMGKLSRVMRRYKQEARKTSSGVTDEEVLGDLYSVYYDNRDLKLLLDLLAESSGIAPSIRVMSLFDKRFRARTQPQRLTVVRDASDGCQAAVSFEDAPTLTDIFAHIDGVACIYTVEIRPPTASSACVAFKFGDGGGAGGTSTKNVIVNAEGDTELQPLQSPDSVPRKKTVFCGLDPRKEYTVRVSTLINGRAVAKSSVAVPNHAQDN